MMQMQLRSSRLSVYIVYHTYCIRWCDIVSGILALVPLSPVFLLPSYSVWWQDIKKSSADATHFSYISYTQHDDMLLKTDAAVIKASGAQNATLSTLRHWHKLNQGKLQIINVYLICLTLLSIVKYNQESHALLLLHRNVLLAVQWSGRKIT